MDLPQRQCDERYLSSESSAATISQLVVSKKVHSCSPCFPFAIGASGKRLVLKPFHTTRGLACSVRPLLGLQFHSVEDFGQAAVDLLKLVVVVG